jgi:hypothetical protein
MPHDHATPIVDLGIDQRRLGDFNHYAALA